MSFSVLPTARFRREAKPLSKKYASFKEDLEDLITLLEQDANQGESLGGGLNKVRLAITSKGKGKSGGSRVITFVVLRRAEVYLIAVYDKSEKDSLSQGEMAELRKSLPQV